MNGSLMQPDRSHLTQCLPPGVRFIERDWLSCNQVLMLDPQGATLIDSGYGKHAAMTEAIVRERLRAEQSPRLLRIINTHLHSDHCGGNAQLVRAFGCKVRVPAAEAQLVTRWDEAQMHFSSVGQRLERFAADELAHPGDELTLGGVLWQVLSAPGHDPHSLMLYCASHRLLISADALWENGFGVNFPELAGDTSGFDEQQAVLDLIAQLPIDCVLPGHGPMFGDVQTALARAYKRLGLQREDPVRHARYAIKVLVKFFLLDHERVEQAALVTELSRSKVIQQCARIISRAQPFASAESDDSEPANSATRSQNQARQTAQLVMASIDELVAQAGAQRNGLMIINT